jgi:hypothetical protein
MASIDNPREEEYHHTFLFPGLKQMRVNIMSLSSKLGELVGKSSQPPSLDSFPPRLSF